MSSPTTYPSSKIGYITHSTEEERIRECDRWVVLRMLRTLPPTVPIEPASTEPSAPQTRALFHAIDQRHAAARSKTLP